MPLAHFADLGRVGGRSSFLVFSFEQLVMTMPSRKLIRREYCLCASPTPLVRLDSWHRNEVDVIVHQTPGDVLHPESLPLLEKEAKIIPAIVI